MKCGIRLLIRELQPYNRRSLGMDKLFHHTLYSGRHFLYMLELNLIHVDKRGSWTLQLQCERQYLEATDGLKLIQVHAFYEWITNMIRYIN